MMMTMKVAASDSDMAIDLTTVGVTSQPIDGDGLTSDERNWPSSDWDGVIGDV